MSNARRLVDRMFEDETPQTGKFKVEMLFSYGWDDAGWTEEDEAGHEAPTRFDTEAEANAAIDEFLADVRDAVEHGDMASGHDRSEFRVVPA